VLPHAPPLAGWADDGAWSSTRRQAQRTRRDATVLALGGASWQRLGSDGAWVPLLHARGVDLAPLQPSNCGFDVAWSEHLTSRHAGAPLKSVAISWTAPDGTPRAPGGEFVLSRSGVEGSLIYAASAALRDTHRTRRPGHASSWTCCRRATPTGCGANWRTRAARAPCPRT
jgi:predicted flavoprotein YhiN